MAPKPFPVRFVLLRTQGAENLGACARALKNCGFSDWVLVSPEIQDFEPARRMAVHAQDVLETVKTVDSLDEAIADCVWVVGTSSKPAHGKRRLLPRTVAEEVGSRHAGGRVAIVFGDERSGLRADEVARCHDLSTIPSNSEQPSLNLAQAVLLYAYELRLCALGQAPRAPAPLPQLAPNAFLERVQDALAELLRRGGFLTEGGRHALGDLFAPLRRARLTQREAELWNAALRSVGKRLPEER